ncbi:condensation domain-containing protein [Microbacterium sp. P04]|uniref:condensation domain-containing protein n=1 Tax=Microbacterium sp. P04 TaxID=3366947 RepID=UPI003745EF66
MRILRVGGARSGEAVLTWGQRYMLEKMSWLGDGAASSNLRVTFAPPTGTSVEAFAKALTAVAARNEALRTVFDDSRPGDERQVLLREGRLALYVVDSADVEDGVALRNALTAAPFELVSDLPVRAMCLVDEGGLVERATLVFSHMAVDSTSRYLVIEQLIAALLGRFRGDPSVLQPLNLVDLEKGDALRRRSDRALARWRTDVDTATLSAGLRPKIQRRPSRWRSAVIDSPRLNRAVEVISRDRGVSASTVLLVFQQRMAARILGDLPQVVVARASNRGMAHLRGYVGQLHQEVPLRLGGARDDLGDAVNNAQQTSIAAYRYGVFDPRALTAQMEKALSPRERWSAFGLVYNFVQDHGKVSAREVPPPPHDSPAVRWLESMNFDISHLYFSPGTDRNFQWLVDTEFLPAGEFEAAFRELHDEFVDVADRMDA